jgi:transcriptional regulator with XRE-family HTH domain
VTSTAIPKRRPGELRHLSLSQARHLGLGDRFRWARERRDISQERMAEIVSTSRRHIIRIENGTHRPKPELRARIAKATKQPAELFADDEDEESDPVAVDLVKTLMRRLEQHVEIAVERALQEHGL